MPQVSLSPSRSHAVLDSMQSKSLKSDISLSPSKSCIKLSPNKLVTETNQQNEPHEGELARDFFVDCGTHTFPYGQSYQMDPNLPGEADVMAQRQICDNVESWANSLLQTVDDLLTWKDQMVAVHALPTNAISGLAIIASRFCRCKGRLQEELTRMLEMTHVLIGNLLLNSHIQQYKANMIDMSVAMDNEKMVLAEDQCKLRAALAQISRMKASHRMFRWCRLSSRLRERQLAEELERQTKQFDQKREEFHQVVKGQREHMQKMSEELTHLKTFQSATQSAQHTKIVLMPATAQTQAKAARLKSAPVRSVPFVKPDNPPKLDMEIREPPPKLQHQSPPKPKQKPTISTSNQVEGGGVTAQQIVKPPATVRPSTSGATPRSQRHQRIPKEALQLVSPADMSVRERDEFYKESWEERRQKQREEMKQKQLYTIKLENPESTPQVDSTVLQLDGVDEDGVVAIAAAHGAAFINSLGVRRKKSKS